jgi:hypothetical protein
MTRNSLIISGALGLVANIALTAFCIFVMVAGWIPPLLHQPLPVFSLFIFLLFFSLAEIPVMILGMRRMLASVNPRARYVVLVVNFGYTLFAGVYAAPFILLAGKSAFEMVIGVLMSTLGFIRFISAMLFLPTIPKTLQRTHER